MSDRIERVKTKLRSGEVCALRDFYGDALANGRNDIGTLRRRGWDIEAWLARHDAEAPQHKHYRLRRLPL